MIGEHPKPEERFKFRVSYDLESAYVDVGTGRAYRLRLGCHHSITRKDYLSTVQALVGAVINEAYGRVSAHEFPPANVVRDMRKMVGVPLVGARFREDWTVEYNGPKPHVSLMWRGTTTMLTAWAGLCHESFHKPNTCDVHLW